MLTVATDPAHGDNVVGGTRVYILDSHALVRLGLRELLEEAHLEVVGESGSAAEASRRIPELQPDLVVIGAHLPDGTGIEVCREIRSDNPDLRCLLLSSYDDDHALRGAVLAGAVGYVLRQLPGTALVEGIRRVAIGESLLAPGAERAVMEGLYASQDNGKHIGLSPEELRVLALMGQGLTNRQISEETRFAGTAVKIRVAAILSKLGFELRG
ncbi:response regulator transcription factor [Arthrobacter sp. 24S4-2]|uniref:response regulator transcription factor n=1 Tax=Arthrobacter sp. 24S4-2 TaxID=2575374 RepID=UPI0010C7AD10|nr:response regulator transcription factor [Arthrobacter sp. 24S4-2]QCO99878.1 response regulator transcription factor [Arthrobacter sp. 24S4-2]